VRARRRPQLGRRRRRRDPPPKAIARASPPHVDLRPAVRRRQPRGHRPRGAAQGRRSTRATIARGVVDTSVVIDLDRIVGSAPPDEMAISAVTLAELAAGPRATADPQERARRQDRLQRTEATFDPLPLEAAAARAFGRIYAAAATAGREARGRRAADLLIAVTALSADLPLYTRNPRRLQAPREPARDPCGRREDLPHLDVGARATSTDDFRDARRSEEQQSLREPSSRRRP
jgi:predicted nucleic acid-binding protein